MSSFKERLTKGQKLQNEFINFLDKNNIGYFVTGYEGLYCQNNADINIIKNNSITSNFVRHYPDLTLASKKDTYFIEVKNSSGIEKIAWDNYHKLSKELGLNVLFYLRDKKIYPINDIVFKKMKPYCHVSKMNVPVKEGIWKCPREMSERDYKKYLASFNYRTSGCSFALIDFNKSKGYNRSVLKKINK